MKGLLERSGPRRFWLGVLVLLLAAGILRAWNLTAAGVWHDEALSHYYALQEPGWILVHSAGKINHPPLFFLLLRGWLTIVPTFNQWAVELLNLLVSLVGLGVFARWSRLFFFRTKAFVLTGLLVLHPFHVHFSTELRMYPLALTAVIVAGYFATRLLRNDLRGATDWIGWTFSCLVALYTHSFSGVYVALMVLFLGYRAVREGRWRSALSALAVLLACYGPWLVFVARQAARIASNYWIGSFQFRQLLILVYRYAGYVGPKTPGVVTLIKSLLACAGFVAPLLWSLKRRSFLTGFYWLLVAVPVLLITVLSTWGEQSVFLYRSFLFGLPFAWMLIGFGVEELPVGHMFLALLAVLLAWDTYGLKIHPPFRHLKEMARTLQQEANGRPTFHLATHSYYPALFYRRHAGPDYLVGRDKVTGRTVTRQQLFQASRTGSVLVVVPRDHHPDVRESLHRRRTVRMLHRAKERGHYDVLAILPSE